MNTNSAAEVDSELFGGAPLLRLYRRCGLLRPGPNVARRGVLAVCIAYLTTHLKPTWHVDVSIG